VTLPEETGRNREHKLWPIATTPVFYSTNRNIYFFFDIFGKSPNNFLPGAPTSEVLFVR